MLSQAVNMISKFHRVTDFQLSSMVVSLLPSRALQTLMQCASRAFIIPWSNGYVRETVFGCIKRLLQWNGHFWVFHSNRLRHYLTINILKAKWSSCGTNLRILLCLFIPLSMERHTAQVFLFKCSRILTSVYH